ncbi:hypothetical protein, partial [Nocardia farcinica]|uniref:hypothetical protein n=1 Tax=Nocardia farcinica TaxID=37329 RepID=UPI00245752DE
ISPSGLSGVVTASVGVSAPEGPAHLVRGLSQVAGQLIPAALCFEAGVVGRPAEKLPHAAARCPHPVLERAPAT